jgi:hypothetical protein
LFEDEGLLGGLGAGETWQETLKFKAVGDSIQRTDPLLLELCSFSFHHKGHCSRM